ncbi:15661_t:CDS:2 [Funneliformis geosporum]|uniref:15661_t:CDS:1 n=1 Tax=Funneliformis geosporum TaxID=1117311 RepID=A0A9W4WMS5_9GLOM|nr:15661_t:CDS:2 [Funneliformis geosporum]
MNSQEGRNFITKDERFLKGFLKDFHNRVLYADHIGDFKNFENKMIKWINFIASFQFKSILELMVNHQKNEIWFSSLIGFFHQHGIGGCVINVNRAYEYYLLSKNIEDENHFYDDLKKYNTVIGNYLLALYCYKEIIMNNSQCYLHGNGTDKDEKEAFAWYLKSAKAGNTNAQYSLGGCYYYGKGTNKDKEKSFEWYLKAARGGNSIAQYYLGTCYSYGIDVDKDVIEAFECMGA